MAREIVMPRLSDSMEEGTILKWLVAAGDAVSPGDPIVEVETDKAVVTHEADEAATVLGLLAPEGASVAVGAPIMVVGEAGETLPDPVAFEHAPPTSERAESVATVAAASAAEVAVCGRAVGPPRRGAGTAIGRASRPPRLRAGSPPSSASNWPRWPARAPRGRVIRSDVEGRGIGDRASRARGQRQRSRRRPRPRAGGRRPHPPAPPGPRARRRVTR